VQPAEAGQRLLSSEKADEERSRSEILLMTHPPYTGLYEAIDTTPGCPSFSK
jgi:hypothetical protein